MSSVIEKRKPAEVYDEQFVPALFAPWGPVVAADPKRFAAASSTT